MMRMPIVIRRLAVLAVALAPAASIAAVTRAC